MEQNNQKIPFMVDALYCEEAETEECFRDEDEQERLMMNPEPPLLLSEKDFSWGDEELSSLLSKEQENGLSHCLENNPSMSESRQDAVDWMLKVVAHYSFSALTAILAVNYLDRFLHSFKSHTQKPWMTQLTAVSCLSLAAKVEETHVPLLLDLQVEECQYVFEAKTIQRMEILVLSTLEWKMNPVTPLSFIDYITRRLGLKTHLSWEFLRRCECLLLAIIYDCRFMCYLPSVMATATMLHVINNIETCTFMELQEQLLSILGINKEKMEECSRLIHEVASSVEFLTSNKRKLASLPCSPKGVMDVSFSSNTSYDSSSSSSSSPSSSPEPFSKKIRTLST